MSDLFEDKNGVVRKRREACKHGHLFDGTEKWHTNWKGYLSRVCRVCAKERMRRKRENPNFKALQAANTKRWRENNPETYRDSYRAAYKKRDEWIQSFKVKCKYCEENRFPCLDFHHRDSDEKMGTIGQVRHWPKEKLLAEIEKCDVVCANCHRWLHYLEKTEGE